MTLGPRKTQALADASLLSGSADVVHPLLRGLRRQDASPACPRSPAALVAAGNADDSAQVSAFERKKAEVTGYFKERGITDLAEIPKAIFLYEVTSAGIMFAMWGICFMAQVRAVPFSIATSLPAAPSLSPLFMFWRAPLFRLSLALTGPTASL